MLASFALTYTLVPTMAKYILKAHHAPAHDAQPVTRQSLESNVFARFQQAFQARFERFRDRYSEQLEQVIARRGRFVTISLAIALGSLALFYFSGREFFPQIKGGLLQMHMRAPLGLRVEAAGRTASLVSKDIREMIPGNVEGVVSNCGLPVGAHNLAFIPTPTIGTQDCDLTITLKNVKSPVWEYRRILRKGLAERYPGTEFTFQPADLTDKILNFGSLAPIDLQVTGPNIYANYAYAQKLASKFRQIPGAADVYIWQTMSQPTILVEGNRRFALGLNLNQKDFGFNMLLATAGSQQIDQKYWLDRTTGMSYRINVYTPQPQLASVKDLMTIPVAPEMRTQEEALGNQNVQLLGNLTNFSLVGTPGVVTHRNLLPMIDVLVSAEGRDLGGVLADIRNIAESMKDERPRGSEIEIHGQAEVMHEAFVELLGGLIAAIVLVYLLTVINFQSWLDPFIIITALVGAFAGIAWSIFVTHTNISVPALTGAIMTMGTATANSILLVAYARERLAIHGDALRAAVEAGTARIRPVLMTAAAMIIGMLPMSMGNSQNAPLGRAVMGGLAVATLFTLYFVPCLYAMIYTGRSARQERSLSL
jgi:multidrug efflux pump subunit AcrB